MNKNKKNWTLIGIITIMLFIFLLGYMQVNKNRNKEPEADKIENFVNPEEEILGTDGEEIDDVSSGEAENGALSGDKTSNENSSENASSDDGSAPLVPGDGSNFESAECVIEGAEDKEADAQEKYIDFVML